MLRVAISLSLTVPLVAAAIHASADQAHACSCPSFPLEFKLEHSDAVFAGEVILIRERRIIDTTDYAKVYGFEDVELPVDQVEDIVKFRVNEIWKGESYETVFIKIKWSNPVDHDYMLPCGYDPPFHEGWRYLLFAAGGQTSLGICSWSDDLDSYQSQEIVAELGVGKKPIPGSVGPMSERVGEPVPTPTVPAPAKVVQPTSEPTAPAPPKSPNLAAAATPRMIMPVDMLTCQPSA